MVRGILALACLLSATRASAQTVVFDIQSRCLLGPAPDDSVKLEIGKPWPDPLGRPQSVDGGVFFQWDKSRLCADSFHADPFNRRVRFEGNVVMKDEKGSVIRGSTVTFESKPAEAFFEAAKNYAPK